MHMLYMLHAHVHAHAHAHVHVSIHISSVDDDLHTLSICPSGQWHEGKKYGYAKFTYANGDAYEGEHTLFPSYFIEVPSNNV